MDNKRKTSILYAVSNLNLRNMVIFEFGFLVSLLGKGPEQVQNYLLDNWEKTKEQLVQRTDIEVLDKDKKVSKEDFKITFRNSDNKEPIYFISFPDSNNNIAESKCVALALTEDRPRIFTIEYSSSLNNEMEFIFGEWKFNYINGGFNHYNYGKLTNPTIENFATRVLENLNEK